MIRHNTECLHVQNMVLKYSQTLWQCVMYLYACGITKFVPCSLFKKTYAVANGFWELDRNRELELLDRMLPFKIQFIITGVITQFDSCV